MKKQVLNLVALAAMKSAKRAGNCASILGLYQPKEPKTLQKK